MLLKKLGIHNLSRNFNDYYKQVIIPLHLEFWRRQIGDDVK